VVFLNVASLLTTPFSNWQKIRLLSLFLLVIAFDIVAQSGSWFDRCRENTCRAAVTPGAGSSPADISPWT